MTGDDWRWRGHVPTREERQDPRLWQSANQGNAMTFHRSCMLKPIQGWHLLRWKCEGVTRNQGPRTNRKHGQRAQYIPAEASYPSRLYTLSMHWISANARPRTVGLEASTISRHKLSHIEFSSLSGTGSGPYHKALWAFVVGVSNRRSFCMRSFAALPARIGPARSLYTAL